MGEVSIDPDGVDRVADRLDEKATEGIALRKRASGLGLPGVASGLSSVISWAEGTASALRVAADIARQGDGPGGLEALSLYGLVAPGVVSAPRREDLLGALQQTMLDAENVGPDQRAQNVRDYFAALTPQERSWLAVNTPDAVGGLDGAPSAMRFAANRVLIERALTHERAKLAGAPDGGNDPDLKKLRNRVARLESFLTVTPTDDALDFVTGSGRKEMSGRQFLLFDDACDGKAAEVLGDLAGAENVAVMVPGITNRLDNFDGLVKDGQRLLSAADSRAASGQAVVVWLGYDTPEFGDSPVPDDAEIAGPQLDAFRAGLDLPSEARTSLFAHSYGTLVASKALQDGAKFDDVVFMGSPGLGSDVKSVHDLDVATTTKTFAMRAPGDYVSYTQALGHDPSQFSDLTRLATNASGAPKVSGHSLYYEAGSDGSFTTASESLRNLTRVMIGDPSVTMTHTTVAQETSTVNLPGNYVWSWGVAERRLTGVMNHSPNSVKRHLGWIDPAKDAATEAIRDTRDAVVTADDWTQEGVADGTRLAGEAVSGTVHGVDTAADWTGDHAEDAWHAVNPFD